MRFPFDDDDATDAAMRRLPRISTVALVCLLLLGIVGVWKLLPHRTASTSTAAQARNDNSLNATLVWIPSGTFTMGAAKDETNGPNVGGQATVTLTKGFWLGQTEVTQGQWQRVMHTQPWGKQADVLEGDDYPVTFVSWRDAMEFCKRLTQEERAAGRLPADWEYTLPTEAQWEFACRAGTTTQFSFGDNGSDLGEYGWFADNANSLGDRFPHRVGHKKANPWGLYDMHGNVSEWCWDVFVTGTLPGGDDPVVTSGGSKRVMRGGNWGNPAIDCQSAARTRRESSYRGHALGFRLAMLPLEQPYAPVTATNLVDSKPAIDSDHARSSSQSVRDEQRISDDNARPGKTQLETAFEKSRALLDKTKDFTPKQIFSLSLNDAKELLGEPLDSGEQHVVELGAEAGEKWTLYTWGSYTTGKHSEDDPAIIVLSMDFGPDNNIRHWVRMKPYLVNGQVKKEWVDEYDFINRKWVQFGHKPGEPRYRQVDF